MPRILCITYLGTYYAGRRTFFFFLASAAKFFSTKQLSTSTTGSWHCNNDYTGYVAPSNSGNTGYTAMPSILVSIARNTAGTRQHCEYGEFLLHMNACGEKSIMMNRQVLRSLFLYQVFVWYLYLPAGKKPQYIGTHQVFAFFSWSSDFNGTIIKDILHCYSIPWPIEGPLLPLYEQVHTYTELFIHSITVPILDVLLQHDAVVFSNWWHYPEIMSTNKMPTQARPVEQIIHNITF